LISRSNDKIFWCWFYGILNIFLNVISQSVITQIAGRLLLIAILIICLVNCANCQTDTTSVDDKTIYVTLPGRFDKHWTLGKRETGISFVSGPYKTYEIWYLELKPRRELILWEENEIRLYKNLAKQSLKPDFLVFEFTQYPLSWLVAETHNYHPDIWRIFDLTDQFNFLASLGGGYQEPWSWSIFLGKLSTFWEMDDDYNLLPAASGAAGFVVTAGTKQIYDNYLVDANWCRVEWKLKGEGKSKNKKRVWDIKAGFRWPGISELPNTITMIYSRQRTDKKQKYFNLYNNSSLLCEIQIPYSSAAVEPTLVRINYGKVVPVSGILAGINIGIGYEFRQEYDFSYKAFKGAATYIPFFYIQPKIIL